MSDAVGGYHLSEWVSIFSGVSVLGCGLIVWIWRVAREALTKDEADQRYMRTGASFLKAEAEARFANRESCAIQHANLERQFASLETSIAREALATRTLIETLHKRRPRREDDDDGTDFARER